tara:strand:+ start:326 stop:574 length:249 start_codon:yes stop_codon:yes gene_type:complete
VLSPALSPMKQVTFTSDEFDLVFNLLQDHLEEICEDQFLHKENHDQALIQEQLTVDALRSMKLYDTDVEAMEAYSGGAGLTA